MSSSSPTRGPVEAPCISCGGSLKGVERGQNCPSCGVPWTSPALRFFWRAQVIGALVIPLMFIGGAIWFMRADSENRDWPGRFLLLAFILGVAHLVAGLVWNLAVPDYHRPTGTGKVMAFTFVVLVLVGIFMPAMGRC